MRPLTVLPLLLPLFFPGSPDESWPGVDRLAPLLEEHELFDAYEALAARGVRYVGSDTTRIACHPACRDAGRITDAHRVEFRSMNEAASAGYRPCRRCRPVAA